MTYLLLFYEFFKTGLFAVGGGMATLPFLYDMSARHPDWFSASQIADMVAVSESTPGPIGVNMATYVGFQVGSIPGAIVATIGLVTPSIHRRLPAQLPGQQAGKQRLLRPAPGLGGHGGGGGAQRGGGGPAP